MQMVSISFWLFIVLVIFALLICNKVVDSVSKKVKYSKIILLISSYLFILYADIKFAIILGILTLITWWAAKDYKNMKYGIIACLLALGYFKYTNFFLSSFSELLGNSETIALKIILPLGISFYTFSAISYIVDVHHKKIEEHSLLDVALYLSFFPKLTSGPIQRSGDFFNQIQKPREINWDNISRGVQIFVFGLFKKIVLADRLSVFVNQVYDTPKAFNSITVFLAVVAYSMQIYFDFSGYSDMAIGVGKMFDIDLPRNFNLPYLSQSVTELWKRWHITLSSWLMEYLYFPLGGNRKGKVRTYINLMLTMLIGGLWHGPSWTFIFWGGLHGLALCVHKLWMLKFKNISDNNSMIKQVFNIILTFLFASLCWIFFRTDSLEQAFSIIQVIISFKTGIFHPYVWLFFALVVYGVAVCFAIRKSRVQGNDINEKLIIEGYYPMQNLDSFWGLVIFFVFCGVTLGLAYTGGSPFIYGAY